MHIPVNFVIRARSASPAATLRAYAERRLSFALRRFENRARHVTVRLADLNGPRRGVDSRCAITLHLLDGRRIVVEATTAWPFASVTHAAKRLNAAVRRELDRTGLSARRHRRIRAPGELAAV